jgi:hypothetical protein
MAFLSPHYAYDAFVSYSHGHPQGAGDSPLKCWSLALIKALRADILDLSADFDALEIWIDEQIDPTAELTEAIRNTVKASAILIVLMSDRYLKSSWCRDEREWFESQVKNRIQDLSCVLVVRVTKTDDADWPSFLRDERGHAVVGFRFHPVPDHPDDIVEPYGWPDLIERNESFRKELSNLRTVFTRRLLELKERAPRQARPPQVGATPTARRRPRIYLHARPEHDHLRAQVEQALSSLGCDSVAMPPGTVQTLSGWTKESEQRIQLARRCDALALLRAVDDGFYGDLLDVGIDDRERITADRGRALPCAVLDAAAEPLPTIASTYGIERFRLDQPNWKPAFRSWLDEALCSTDEARA